MLEMIRKRFTRDDEIGVIRRVKTQGEPLMSRERSKYSLNGIQWSGKRESERKKKI